MGGRVWEGCLPTLAVGYAPWRGGHLGGGRGGGPDVLESNSTPSLRAVGGAHGQRGSVWTPLSSGCWEKRLILPRRQDEAENPT